jgi:hypothetical protein
VVCRRKGPRCDGEPVRAPGRAKGIDWTTIGIGIGGSLIAVGAIAFITDRMRHPHARISV